MRAFCILWNWPSLFNYWVITNLALRVVFRLGLAEAGRNRCAVSVRLAGGSWPPNLTGRFKDMGYWLWIEVADRTMAATVPPISACRSGISTNFKVPVTYMTVFKGSFVLSTFRLYLKIKRWLLAINLSVAVFTYEILLTDSQWKHWESSKYCRLAQWFSRIRSTVFNVIYFITIDLAEGRRWLHRTWRSR